MTVNPYYRYSNKAERTNEDIYDDFKFYFHGLYKNISAF